MNRSTYASSGDARLERLLEQVDDIIDAQAHGDDDWAVYWEAWDQLPYTIRDFLLTTVPEWWSLPAVVFRRLLLTTAGLIVWDGVRPRAALQRAAHQLRLPPPRRTSPRPVRRPPPVRPRPVRARSPWRLPARLRTASVRRRLRAARRFPGRARRRMPLRRGGGFRRVAFRR